MAKHQPAIISERSSALSSRDGDRVAAGAAAARMVTL